jgi:serine/threonine protein kinase
MIGKTISHYKILEKLGEGGMGVVYKAEDTKLKRMVALKFLPPELTRDSDAKKRFIQEAQAASALQHNNICTIHEIDETKPAPGEPGDGQLFICMDFYEGETLNKKIERGPLPLDEAIEIAIQIVQGLARAHEADIIHRDIKPANILITDRGEVKIVDFGLARAAGQTRLTKASTTLGTVAYMSPEQARGEDADQRTDIWSLGVVLYEMVTGRLPFTGDYEQAMMYWILNDAPKPVKQFRSEVPANLEQAICKALEKDRIKRYQNIRELLQDIKTSPASIMSETKREKSIVVLPFENLSPDPDQEYFSDGLTEEIITDLSNVHDLLVISRTSAMRLKGTNKDIKTIGKELNVQYVLEGSVRKAGNNLRITTQLINVTNDAHLWAEKYGGTLDDIFDIQEKVSRSIVDALKVRLNSEEERHIAQRPISDLVVYECYLRAKQELSHYTQDAIDRSIKLLKKGLEIEGPNELLIATLGAAYLRYWILGIRPEESVLREAERCAEKVFDLNSDSPELPVLRGGILFHRGQIQEAVKHLKEAYCVYPNNPTLLFYLVAICGSSGHIDVGRLYYEKLTSVEPWSGINPGWLDFYNGQFEAAVNGYRKEYEIDTKSPYARWAYASTLAWAQRIEEACQIFEQLVQDTPKTVFGQFGALFLNALQGNTTEALEAVTPELVASAKPDFQWPWMIASCYAMIKKVDESLYWLEHAVSRGFINYPFLNEYDPFLENIRSEERFKRLMERVKYKWENFEV